MLLRARGGVGFESDSFSSSWPLEIDYFSQMDHKGDLGLSVRTAASFCTNDTFSFCLSGTLEMDAFTSMLVSLRYPLMMLSSLRCEVTFFDRYF